MFWMIPVGYLVIVNLFTFLVVWNDKRRAQRGKWRVKEGTLYKLGLAGGIWGLIFGMRRFRHKTSKASFLVVTTLIFGVNLVYYYLIWTYFL